MGWNYTRGIRACILILMSLCLTFSVNHETRLKSKVDSTADDNSHDAFPRKSSGLQPRIATAILGGYTRITTSLDRVVVSEKQTAISDRNGRPPEKERTKATPFHSANHIPFDFGTQQQLTEDLVSKDSAWTDEEPSGRALYRRRSLKSIDADADNNDDVDEYMTGAQMGDEAVVQDDEEEEEEDITDVEDDEFNGEDMEAEDEDTSAVEIRPIFDKRAFCQPRRHPVNVPQPEDPTLIYQPMCIQVERCGGCCAHELFECVPSVIKNATRKVVALRYPHSGAEYFVFEAVAKVQIERHTKCKCQCKTQPEHCSMNQIYDRQNCQCVCEQQNGHLKCKAPQVWSDKECRCRCPEFSECSTGTYFDTRMCRCRAAGEILAQSKLFKSQLRRLYH